MAINSIGVGGTASYGGVRQTGPATGIAGVPAPEYGPGRIPTKTKAARSDGEVRQSIVDMAKRDAARRVYGGDMDGHGRQSGEWQRLMNEYVSPYSPDRKALFAKRMKEIGDGLKQNPFRAPEIDTSFMELMLTGEVKDKEQSARGAALERMIKKYNGDLGGNTITGEVKMIAFTDGGEDIGSWSATYGWGYCPTRAERARMAEMAGIYNAAWKAASGSEEMRF